MAQRRSKRKRELVDIAPTSSLSSRQQQQEEKQMNEWGYLVLGILLAVELFQMGLTMLDRAHARRIAADPPDDILEIYPADQINKAVLYFRERSRVGMLRGAVRNALFFWLLLSGTLGQWSHWINTQWAGDVVRGLVFFGGYYLIFGLVSLPFQCWTTFGVEKKYGFNRTTGLQFGRDHLLETALSAVLGGLVLWVLVVFIGHAGEYWWVFASGFMIFLSAAVVYVYPTWIAPLFNKFEPLEEGELRERINGLARITKFPLKDILRMDASRRSTHSNAYFTGFGDRRRVVLYDTLLERHPMEEIVAILAHEIGHSRLGHIWKRFILNGVMVVTAMWLCGLLINKTFMYEAFGLPHEIYIGLFLVSIILSPVGFLTTPVKAWWSRRHEFAADRFAVVEMGESGSMERALSSLYRENLANPLPHPAAAFFYYSHPVLIERIRAIRHLTGNKSPG
jgi:STE24 endopeptidase